MYFTCLKELKEKMKEQKTPLVLHTDQGSVYALRVFHDAHKGYNIMCCMFRVAISADNPIIESINGLIKKLVTDFRY